MSIGDTLATARRQAGLTVTQVSQRTCIRETIIRGIERGDFSACGGDFYARGHIRSIARAVGLDPDELIREYDATQSAPQPISAADVFQPFTPVKLKERRRPNWTLVLLAGVAVILGVAAFRYFDTHGNKPTQSHNTASTHTTHQTQSHPKATTTPVAQVPHNVKLTLIGKPGRGSWAELTTRHGRVIFMGDVGSIVGANSVPRITKSWPSPLTLRLGNPRGIVLYVNGTRERLHSLNPLTLTCTKTACH